jgi:hypothetical protein
LRNKAQILLYFLVLKKRESHAKYDSAAYSKEEMSAVKYAKVNNV